MMYIQFSINTPVSKMPEKSEVKKATEALERENKRLEEENRKKEKEIAELLKKIKNAR